MKKQRFKVLSLLLALSLTAAGCGKTAGTASSADSAGTSSAQTAESVSASGAATAESTASTQAANSQSSQTESTPAAAEDTGYGVSPAATTAWTQAVAHFPAGSPSAYPFADFSRRYP